MTVGKTARGIGIRALILLAGVLLVGFWLVSLALDLVGAVIQIALWGGLILIAAGAFAVLRHRLRRR